MVPRNSTEALVRTAVHRLTNHQSPTTEHATDSTRRVLDLGCGPGNALISVLWLLDGSHTEQPRKMCGLGLDLSDQALTLARTNAAALLGNQPHVTARFDCRDFGELHHLTCDFWSRVTQPATREIGVGDAVGCGATAAAAPFDLILCNPPYLAQELQVDLVQAAPELQAEPAGALFAAAHGTAAYTAIVASIAACSPPVLAMGGVLLFEVGKAMEQAVHNAIASLGITGCKCTTVEVPIGLPAECGVAVHVASGQGHVLEVSFGNCD